jgi:hypothetical protein
MQSGIIPLLTVFSPLLTSLMYEKYPFHRYSLSVLDIFRESVKEHSTPVAFGGVESECRFFFLSMATAGFNYMSSHLKFLFQ